MKEKPRAFREKSGVWKGKWHVTDGTSSGIADLLEDAYKAFKSAKSESEN